MPPRLPALLADPPAGGARLWLTGGRLFDGTGSPVREGAAVLLADGRIEAVGRAGDGVPEGATVIELDGRTLLPGLIDAHAHIKVDRPTPDPGAEPLRPGADAHFLAADLREALRRGITTVRDVGSYGDLVFEARQGMRYGAFRGPRLLTCGRIVSATAPGGWFFDGMYREADGPDDVRRAVREQLRRGADFIKVMTTGARSVELEDPDPAQLTREEIATLVEEAHRQGYRVAAHAEGVAGTEIAILEGIDTIEHGMYLCQRPELLERMARADQVLVPTLSCFYGVAGVEDRDAGDGPGFEDGGAGDSADDGPWSWAPARAGQPPAPTWSALLVELAEHNLEQADLTLRAAKAAGVRLAVGHDWHPFWNTAVEIRRMAAHGLTAAEALAAATSGSAYALGLDDRAGTLTPGKLADLVVIDGDPLSGLELLEQRDSIWLVIQRGAVVGGTAVERHAADLAPARSVAALASEPSR
ncbi:MAG TPA: amidohydrolase family protein [Solirubrobacteraceae bacterium]